VGILLIQEVGEIQRVALLLLLEGAVVQKEVGLPEQVGTVLPREREEAELLEIMQVGLVVMGMVAEVVLRGHNRQEAFTLNLPPY
jgi:acyl CoA:acetate/3-ketoacid CoA transferase